MNDSGLDPNGTLNRASEKAVDSKTSADKSGSSEIILAPVKSLEGKSETGKFVIRHLTVRERTMIGFKWLGISWLIALIFLPFPIIHFVMVPLFLVLGPVAWIFGFKATMRIDRADFNCPVCTKPIEFLQMRYKADFKETCPHCLNGIYIKFPQTAHSLT